MTQVTCDPFRGQKVKVTICRGRVHIVAAPLGAAHLVMPRPQGRDIKR